MLRRYKDRAAPPGLGTSYGSHAQDWKSWAIIGRPDGLPRPRRLGGFPLSAAICTLALSRGAPSRSLGYEVQPTQDLRPGLIYAAPTALANRGASMLRLYKDRAAPPGLGTHFDRLPRTGSPGLISVGPPGLRVLGVSAVLGLIRGYPRESAAARR